MVLAQKHCTRIHGHVNTMEKAAAYKMKKNLEIPRTFKGKSFSTIDPTALYEQASKVNVLFGGDETNKFAIIEDLITREQEIVWLLPMVTQK